MAHGLAVLAWDRIIGAPPSSVVPSWAGQSMQRDPHRPEVVAGWVTADGDAAYSGGFAAQLPAGW
jgi:hypothetical protein